MGFYVPTREWPKLYTFPYINSFKAFENSKSLASDRGDRGVVHFFIALCTKNSAIETLPLRETHGLEVNAETVKVDEAFVTIRVMREC